MKKLIIILAVFLQAAILPKNYHNMLKIGIDVDWLTFKNVKKVFFEDYKRDINDAEYFKKMGFSTVRIRIPDNVNLKQLKIAVDESLKAGLIPVLTLTCKNLRENPDKEN